MSNIGEKTGTYKYDKVSGMIIKVSGRSPSLNRTPAWKYNMDSDGERKRAFRSLEDQGKLNQVNDRECQADVIGRDV